MKCLHSYAQLNEEDYLDCAIVVGITNITDNVMSLSLLETNSGPSEARDHKISKMMTRHGDVLHTYAGLA